MQLYNINQTDTVHLNYMHSTKSTEKRASWSSLHWLSSITTTQSGVLHRLYEMQAAWWGSSIYDPCSNNKDLTFVFVWINKQKVNKLCLIVTPLTDVKHTHSYVRECIF